MASQRPSFLCHKQRSFGIHWDKSSWPTFRLYNRRHQQRWITWIDLPSQAIYRWAVHLKMFKSSKLRRNSHLQYHCSELSRTKSNFCWSSVFLQRDQFSLSVDCLYWKRCVLCSQKAKCWGVKRRNEGGCGQKCSKNIKKCWIRMAGRMFEGNFDGPPSGRWKV